MGTGFHLTYQALEKTTIINFSFRKRLKTRNKIRQ